MNNTTQESKVYVALAQVPFGSFRVDAYITQGRFELEWVNEDGEIFWSLKLGSFAPRLKA